MIFFSHLPSSNLTDSQPPRQWGRLLAGSLPQLASLPPQQRAVPQPHDSAEEAARGQATPPLPSAGSPSACFLILSAVFCLFIFFIAKLHCVHPSCCVTASVSHWHFPPLTICRSVWAALSSLLFWARCLKLWSKNDFPWQFFLWKCWYWHLVNTVWQVSQEFSV